MDQIPLSVRFKELRRDTGKHGLNQCRVNLCMRCQNGVWIRCLYFHQENYICIDLKATLIGIY